LAKRRSDTNLESLDKIAEALLDFPMIKKFNLKAVSTSISKIDLLSESIGKMKLLELLLLDFRYCCYNPSFV
jgi:hypothetical protein